MGFPEILLEYRVQCGNIFSGHSFILSCCFTSFSLQIASSLSLSLSSLSLSFSLSLYLSLFFSLSLASYRPFSLSLSLSTSPVFPPPSLSLLYIACSFTSVYIACSPSRFSLSIIYHLFSHLSLSVYNPFYPTLSLYCLFSLTLSVPVRSPQRRRNQTRTPMIRRLSRSEVKGQEGS